LVNLIITGFSANFGKGIGEEGGPIWRGQGLELALVGRGPWGPFGKELQVNWGI